LTLLAEKNSEPMSIFRKPVVNKPVYHHLTATLWEAFHQASDRRACSALSDTDWLEALLRRTLADKMTGRCLLQLLSDQHDVQIERGTFFESLKSERRSRMLRSTSGIIENMVTARALDEHDPFSSIRSLAKFDLYAGDGHYIEHASHDHLIGGDQFATGDFFGLNLRSHALFHLAHAQRGMQRKREHDMHALKRLSVEELRHGAAKGRQVLWVWDKAGIDAQFWVDCKMKHGIYFLSRLKKNMTCEDFMPLPYAADDPNNVGVTAFGLVSVASQMLRCVHYTCPISQQTYSFITTLTTVEPGVIAQLYLARWDIEKSFDETKRKLGEDKSWATTPLAKSIHAEMRVLAHNLLLLFERRLQGSEGISPITETARRDKRIKEAQQKAAENNRTLSPLHCAIMRRVSQRVLPFIRWVRNSIDSTDLWTAMLARLRRYLGAIN